MNDILKYLSDSFYILNNEDKIFIFNIPNIELNILKKLNIQNDYIKFNGKEYILINIYKDNFDKINYLIKNLDIQDYTLYFKNLKLLINNLIDLGLNDIYI